MSRSQKGAAVYVIIMGAGMIGWWTVALITDQMPELHATPIQALMHVAAEAFTGVALIISGVGILSCRWWATKLHLFSLGMLLYALVQVAGYSAQRGQIAAVTLFVAAFVTTLFLFYRATKLERPVAWTGPGA